MSDTVNAARAELERTTAINPATAEVIDLANASERDLGVELAGVSRLVEALNAYCRDLAEEVARRADRRNERKVKVPGLGVLEVNAPTSESYDVGGLLAAFRPLVDAGVVDRELVDNLIDRKAPVTPAPSVRKVEVNKLKRHADPRVLAALAEARTISPNRRTAKVILEEASNG